MTREQNALEVVNLRLEKLTVKVENFQRQVVKDPYRTLDGCDSDIEAVVEVKLLCDVKSALSNDRSLADVIKFLTDAILVRTRGVNKSTSKTGDIFYNAQTTAQSKVLEMLVSG
jgi:hypothetical protein